MYHDLALVCSGGLAISGCLAIVTLTHLHILILVTFLFLLVVVFLVAAWSLKVLAASIRLCIVILSTSSIVSAFHGIVILCSQRCFLLLQSLLELDLLLAILCAIVIAEISLRLFRRELGRRRLIGVPGSSRQPQLSSISGKFLTT